MEPLRIIKGDATVPQAKGKKIIAHICNDLGGWGKGFVLAISRRWQEPEQAYRSWHRERSTNGFGLGAVQLVQVLPDTIPFKVTTPRNHSVLLDRNGLAPIFGLMIHSQTPLKTGVLSTLKGLLAGYLGREHGRPARDEGRKLRPSHPL